MSARFFLVWIAAAGVACGAAKADTQPDASSLGACTASTTFAAIPWRAPNPQQDACTDKEIDEFADACLDGAIPIRCEQFSADHPQCASCIYPKAKDSPPGAILEAAGRVVPNVGGCIALAFNDTTESGCGAREHALRECIAQVCERCDDKACSAQAREGHCRTRALESCPELAVAATCGLSETKKADVKRIARRMCAPPHVILSERSESKDPLLH